MDGDEGTLPGTNIQQPAGQEHREQSTATACGIELIRRKSAEVDSPWKGHEHERENNNRGKNEREVIVVNVVVMLTIGV